MPGTVCNMTFKEFLARWFGQAATALLVWLGLALVLEVLIPGAVTPFVDLIDLVGLACAVGMVALLAGQAAAIGPIRPIGRIGPIARALLTVSAGALGGLYLWSRFTGSSGWQLLLVAAFAALLVLVCLALFVQKPTSATIAEL